MAVARQKKAPGGAFVEEEKKEEKVCCFDRLQYSLGRENTVYPPLQ
jgi:hypothetical protein